MRINVRESFDSCQLGHGALPLAKKDTAGRKGRDGSSRMKENLGFLVDCSLALRSHARIDPRRKRCSIGSTACVNGANAGTSECVTADEMENGSGHDGTARTHEREKESGHDGTDGTHWVMNAGP